MSAYGGDPYGYGSEYSRTGRRRHRNRVGDRRRQAWPEGSVNTELGIQRGLDAEREHDKLYRATLRAVAEGYILGRGRHGVVVALTDDPADPQFSLAVKIVSKVFLPSKGKEPSFHRAVSHTLHVQNEVAALAKLGSQASFMLPLYCAFQDDTYVYLVMERCCCSLKQLIQHTGDVEEQQLLAFQEDHPLKFLSFCTLTTGALLHACWTLQRAHLIHHDIHPAQVLSLILTYQLSPLTHHLSPLTLTSPSIASYRIASRHSTSHIKSHHQSPSLTITSSPSHRHQNIHSPPQPPPPPNPHPNLLHSAVHPAQVLVTSDGRPCLADLGQCSVIPPDGRKTLLPPLGRRDFCRPARLGPMQGAEVDGYGCGATLWVVWKGCYNGGGKLEREWNRHEERAKLQARLEQLATKALEMPSPPRWPFAQLVQRHINAVGPGRFAESVRMMLEELVTACTDDQSPGQVSTFSAEGPFRHVLPFLRLTPALASDPAIALEPTNFALPAVRPDDPWPPPDPGSMLHEVFWHAQAQLRAMESAAAQQRSRSRALRPDLPLLPIALSPVPCLSMLLHPGRVASSSAEPLVRIAIVSMLVKADLPAEIPIVVRASQWSKLDQLAETGSADEGGGAIGGERSDGAGAGIVVLSFSILREEFAQEGPSGPIEAKRVLLLEQLPANRARVTFELSDEISMQLGFCRTPPLMLEVRPQQSPYRRDGLLIGETAASSDAA